MTDYHRFPNPCYIIDEAKLRANLSLITRTAQRAGVEVILAFKSFAMWKSFPIFREYISHATASSLNEALLAYHQMGSKAHTYSPAYTDEEFPRLLALSTHITFNSLSQLQHFLPQVQQSPHRVSCGLRINPRHSEVETALYNPCAPGTRFGVSAEQLGNRLPVGVEGFHCHAHCESSSFELERTLEAVEQQFGTLLPQLKWFNLGGGHLITRKDYDTDHLVHLLQGFKKRYPNLHIILEPGSAFTWQTGVLTAKVVDIVEDCGIRTAVLNVSFTCHMPDCLEMPYQPVVTGARQGSEGLHVYRLGGNSCLSGDFIGDWSFPAPLQVGQTVVFEDMIHYTTVKTNMFNGIHHPAIGILTCEGEAVIYKEFGFQDYLTRMS